jgi:hypothetical protein
VIFLLTALLATMMGGAQCVVRCASPAPAKCPHHSHDKGNPAAQICGVEMLPGVRVDLAPAAAIGPAAIADAVRIALAAGMDSVLPDRGSALRAATIVLRI